MNTMNRETLEKAYKKIFDAIDKADNTEDRFEAAGLLQTVTDALDYIHKVADNTLRLEVAEKLWQEKYPRDYYVGS